MWLADFASCNYLGLDLDREVIDAVPEYLAKWGTHPSWSRLLGSPVLYEQIAPEMIGTEPEGFTALKHCPWRSKRQQSGIGWKGCEPWCSQCCQDPEENNA